MGDLLPPTIYIPYLKMLQGLASGPQCAHYCFSLLKVNGSGHGKQSLDVVSVHRDVLECSIPWSFKDYWLFVVGSTDV